MKNKEKQIFVKNKKATFDYEIIQKYTAGIVLAGTEVKSVRDSLVSLVEGFCTFINGELFIRNIHIAEYANGTYNNHKTKRDRKLLLQKKEIQKLQHELKNKSLTIVPLQLYFNDKGWAKIDIALARGKKQFDKRETIKKKDITRDLSRLD